MKVWLTMHRRDYEGAEVMGIYSSYDKALEALTAYVDQRNYDPDYMYYRKTGESTWEDSCEKYYIKEWDVL